MSWNTKTCLITFHNTNILCSGILRSPTQNLYCVTLWILQIHVLASSKFDTIVFYIGCCQEIFVSFSRIKKWKCAKFTPLFAREESTIINYYLQNISNFSLNNKEVKQFNRKSYQNFWYLLTKFYFITSKTFPGSWTYNFTPCRWASYIKKNDLWYPKCKTLT